MLVEFVVPVIATLDNPPILAEVSPSATVVVPKVTCPVAHCGAYPAPADFKNVPAAPAVIKPVVDVSV